MLLGIIPGAIQNNYITLIIYFSSGGQCQCCLFRNSAPFVFSCTLHQHQLMGLYCGVILEKTPLWWWEVLAVCPVSCLKGRFKKKEKIPPVSRLAKAYGHLSTSVSSCTEFASLNIISTEPYIYIQMKVALLLQNMSTCVSSLISLHSPFRTTSTSWWKVTATHASCAPTCTRICWWRGRK